MKKKRILFLFVTLFASTLLYSQVVGVKTNLVMDAMKIINLGAEVGLSKKLTLDLYANYNPWKYKDQKMMKMLAIQPELRYWFCDKFNGHFVGFHVHGGVYQAAAINMPWGIWPELKDHRFKGNFFDICERMSVDKLTEEYKSYSVVLGKRIKVISSNAEYYATAVDIDKNARLIVRDENGDMHTLSSAEVSVREGQI